MTTLHEEADKALEALEVADDYLADCGIPQDRKVRVMIDASIDALKTALSQQGAYTDPDCLTRQDEIIRKLAKENAELDSQIDQLIQERDHRDEIIDKLCDAVLGPDRYEWSSMYFFEDAVREVEERMEALAQQGEIPPEGSERAEALIQSMLKEYDYPANPTNAARAGYRAARLAGAAQTAQQDTWTDDGGWTFPVERQIIQTR